MYVCMYVYMYVCMHQFCNITTTFKGCGLYCAVGNLKETKSFAMKQIQFILLFVTVTLKLLSICIFKTSFPWVLKFYTKRLSQKEEKKVSLSVLQRDTKTQLFLCFLRQTFLNSSQLHTYSFKLNRIRWDLNTEVG